MQLELKRIQHEVGITFVHVTHDQEEAMTMADTIAVMNNGRIQQLGTPAELYETPRTAFVAGFLGVSNLLHGEVYLEHTVRLDGAGEVHVAAQLPATGSRVAVGVRPEKLNLNGEGANTLQGTVAERAYTGLATQYVVETAAGPITVFVQSAGAVAEGDRVTLGWDPEGTFVLEEAT
jgi:spermidine/putrescine transport system ATP-binding protein